MRRTWGLKNRSYEERKHYQTASLPVWSSNKGHGHALETSLFPLRWLCFNRFYSEEKNSIERNQFESDQGSYGSSGKGSEIKSG